MDVWISIIWIYDVWISIPCQRNVLRATCSFFDCILSHTTTSEASILHENVEGLLVKSETDGRSLLQITVTRIDFYSITSLSKQFFLSSHKLFCITVIKILIEQCYHHRRFEHSQRLISTNCTLKYIKKWKRKIKISRIM